MTLPVLPYPDRTTGSTSGHSGSDTSRRLAENADARGETKGQQRIALRALEAAGWHGITWTELLSTFLVGGYPKAHHGAASRTLSNLHRAGLISRLAETRHDRKVYVLPQHIEGREIELPRDQKGGRLGPVALTDAESSLVEKLQDTLLVCLDPYEVKTILDLLGRLGVKY